MKLKTVVKDAPKMTKDEIRAFYEDLEKKNDPYFYMLPFPRFLVEENPEKYSGMSKDTYDNYINGMECEELAKTDPEKAKEKRQAFLKSLPKPPPVFPPRQKKTFNL